ncbi:MAG: radical SAM protein [Candidatus Omnitrophota bacterium]|jgi:MoaA/NifB/PqqE/SkfB family radical SAM enzyme
MNQKFSPYSYLKIFRHAGKLEAIRNNTVTPPVYIRIKPINVCIHHCSYCSYHDQNLKLHTLFNYKDTLPYEIMTALVEDILEMGVKAVTFSGGGEPLLYPRINEVMPRLLEGGVDLSIITNGQMLKDQSARVLAQAKWVRVSMDSCDAALYARIRDIPESWFHDVCDNIRNFSRIKNPDCELGVNFVVTPDNAGDAYAMARFVKDLGADHIKMTAMVAKDLDVLHAPFKAQVIRDIQKAKNDLEDEGFKVINKYEDDFEMNTVFQRVYSRCPIQQIVTVVAADAKVYLCHDKAYMPNGELGDLRAQRFQEIWFSDSVRKRFREFDAARECRHHCVFDQRNRLINDYFDLNDDHVNFI